MLVESWVAAKVLDKTLDNDVFYCLRDFAPVLAALDPQALVETWERVQEVEGVVGLVSGKEREPRMRRKPRILALNRGFLHIHGSTQRMLPNESFDPHEPS